MRHIKDFPSFSDTESDDLRKKIVKGVAHSWTAAAEADPEHWGNAVEANKEWVQYPCWRALTKWGDGKGFKKIRFKGHALYIHRAAYEMFVGPVPADRVVDHQCRVRDCCQPKHLQAVTHRENIERGANQNHLLRNGAPPPVTAKDVNPRFFDAPPAAEIDAEQRRRAEEQRDIKRYHNVNTDGLLPPAPAGFEWEPASDGFAYVHHVLNPVRARPVADPPDPHEDPFYLKLPPVQPESWLRRKYRALRAWLRTPIW